MKTVPAPVYGDTFDLCCWIVGHFGRSAEAVPRLRRRAGTIAGRHAGVARPTAGRAPDPLARDAAARAGVRPSAACPDAARAGARGRDRPSARRLDEGARGRVDSVPSGPNVLLRALRGGSFDNPAENLRSANRNRNEPGNRNRNIGFRCVRVSRRQHAADEVSCRTWPGGSSPDIPRLPVPVVARRPSGQAPRLRIGACDPFPPVRSSA